MISSIREAAKARLRSHFPERELFIRSGGRVRFLKLTPGAQAGTIAGLGAAALALVGLVAAGTAVGLSAKDTEAGLAAREAKVASAERRVADTREDIADKAAALARRQKFIEEMVEAHIADTPAGAAGSGDAAGDGPASAADGQQAAMHPASFDPGAFTAEQRVSLAPASDAEALYARLESQQFALVERLTRYADARANEASVEIRRLGLDPRSLLAAKARGGEGGPLVRLSSERDGSLDPRLRRMGESLSRMDALQSSLASLPQVMPAHVAYESSSYGYRSDPFTGAAAFHAGIDFPGPKGSPIYAAAAGRVSFVGVRSGYGNCIEIDHGNGLMTRYGHLSRFAAHLGQQVAAGTRIAAMGTTGRSTGPHLHFEVRIDGRPVNPRPFLDASLR